MVWYGVVWYKHVSIVGERDSQVFDLNCRKGYSPSSYLPDLFTDQYHIKDKPKENPIEKKKKKQYIDGSKSHVSNELKIRMNFPSTPFLFFFSSS